MIGQIAGVLLGFAAPLAHAADINSPLREIVVGVPASFPPYFQLDREGRTFGFAIDVTEAVAARAGVKVRYRAYEINGESLAALKDGTIDVMPSLGISKRRLQDFSFTAPIETFQISLFVREDSIDINGLDDLGARPVGSVVPNLAHRILSQRESINLKTYNDAPAALFALLSAQIDAFAYPAPVAWKFAREAGIGDRIKVVGKPIAEVKRAMAVRKGNTELLAILDPAVREFVASEEYRRIYTTWFGAPAVFWTVSRILLAAAVVVVVLLIAMAWWRYQSLVTLNRGLRESISERERAETALRESRDRIRLITDNLPAVICYLDSELRYRFVNRTLAEWYARPAEEILGRTVAEIVGPEVHDRIKSHLEAAGSGKEQRFELNRTFPNGITRVLANDYVPHFNEGGEVQGFFALVHDITEHKRADEQLRQSQKLEAVGQLTAGVAHDFNNMLAVISGNAELLEDELGENHTQLAAVLRATRRGADLTQRLLAFSRKQVLSPKIVNANSLITDITGLLRRTLEEHIDIETVTGAGLWNCEVDPAQLENALVNLALNARDAMPDGGRLTVETANVRLDDDYAAAQAEVTPGRYVMLAITDTGSGMAPKIREHVFEPFFTTKAVDAGSGLGLSMVYGFVKQSGGHVTITSEQGEGTTIKLYLPRSTETATAEKKATTDEAPVARGETVLVVEDDPDVRTLAVALLGNLGYQIMEAATGPAALVELESTTGINLLLTDVMLPGGMNGRELATEVARRVPGIPVLFMSGYAEDAIMHHGRLDADAELLQKPFRRTDLAQAVRKALDASSAHTLDS